MKRIFALLLAFVCLVCCIGCEQVPSEDASTSPTATLTPTQGVVIDENALQFSYHLDQTFQTMDGFGAGFTWYAGNTFRLPADYQNEVLKLLFDDAKLSILRFKNQYDYGDFEDWAETDLKYYTYAKESAESRGEDIMVLYTSWSPPGYLKSSGKIDGEGTLAKDENGNYRYDDFATWWKESVDAYQAAGIPVDVVSIQNECDFIASYDSCEFDPVESEKRACYADAFLATYRLFRDSYGDELPLMIAPETMTVDAGTLKWYVNKILKEEPQSLYGFGHHLYLGGDSSDSPQFCDYDSFLMNFMEVSTYAAENNLKKWQTEFYRGTALQTANVINNSLVYENANAYIYWGGIWNADPGDTFSSSDLIIVGSSLQNWPGEHGYLACGAYYAMRHFSEYIRPGYIRVDAATGSLDVRCSMFKSPEADRLVCVFMNNSDKEQSVQIPLTDYNVTASKVIQSVMGDDFLPENAYLDKGSLTANNVVVLPAGSVTTVVIDGSAK